MQMLNMTKTAQYFGMKEKRKHFIFDIFSNDKKSGHELTLRLRQLPICMHIVT